jgi:hypothetical protein
MGENRPDHISAALADLEEAEALFARALEVLDPDEAGLPLVGAKVRGDHLLSRRGEAFSLAELVTRIADRARGVTWLRYPAMRPKLDRPAIHLGPRASA